MKLITQLWNLTSCNQLVNLSQPEAYVYYHIWHVTSVHGCWLYIYIYTYAEVELLVTTKVEIFICCHLSVMKCQEKSTNTAKHKNKKLQGQSHECLLLITLPLWLFFSNLSPYPLCIHRLWKWFQQKHFERDWRTH